MVIPPPTASRWIVTGARGAGKTTFCRCVAELARAAGQDVAGLLAPPRMEDSDKTGIFVMDLRSGEQHLLASAASQEIDGIRMGRWSFSAPAFQWADAVLSRATPCDLLIVDEIGPLELIRREGLAAWRPALHSDDYRAALAVVRTELEERFRQEWNRSESLAITSPHQAREAAGTFFRRLAGPEKKSGIRC